MGKAAALSVEFMSYVVANPNRGQILQSRAKPAQTAAKFFQEKGFDFLGSPCPK
jgi:hypothetical protein